MKAKGRHSQLRAINAILWKDWDPIGCGVPEDEYEPYAPGVLRLLIEGADQYRLAAHLQRIAQDSMSCPIDEAKALIVAEKLLALGM